MVVPIDSNANKDILQDFQIQVENSFISSCSLHTAMIDFSLLCKH